MGMAELLLLAAGLSMDAFAVSVCKGLGMSGIRWRPAFALALFTGGFQGLMPLIGWGLGSQLMWLIAPIDHWIAFGLLAFIGGNMIREGLSGEDELDIGTIDRIEVRELLMLGVATSIDALAVGISLAALSAPIVFSSITIAITTFFFSLAGVVIGNLFGARYEGPASIVGGIVLIMIGVKVLLEHLGVLAALGL